MLIVYILQSVPHPYHYYIGKCQNLTTRLRQHSTGQCKSTSKKSPWRVETAIFFSDKAKADAFERYLKSGSRRAFSKRRL